MGKINQTKTIMKIPKLFPIRQKVINPDVITYQLNAASGKELYHNGVIRGEYWKVFPTNEKEVFALQMLEHRVDKFAPKINSGGGDGVIVTARALAIFDQR